MGLPNDMSRIAEGLAKLEGASPEYDGNQKNAARRLIRRSYRFETVSENANGSDAVLANANPQQRMACNGRVLGVYVTPKGNATAAATNNCTLALLKADGTGNAYISVASITSNTTANSGTGNLAAGVPVAVPVIAANVRYSKGYTLAPQVSQNGSGVATPAASWTVDVEEESSDDGYKV